MEIIIKPHQSTDLGLHCCTLDISRFGTREYQQTLNVCQSSYKDNFINSCKVGYIVGNRHASFRQSIMKGP